jgi:hypothetical protein
MSSKVRTNGRFGQEIRGFAGSVPIRKGTWAGSISNGDKIQIKSAGKLVMTRVSGVGVLGSFMKIADLVAEDAKAPVFGNGNLLLP